MKTKDLNVDALANALTTLKELENVSLEKDGIKKDILMDSAIQRFEYTIEIAWKIMKKYLKLEYGKTDTELTVNNIFRLMQGYKMISNWENWREYYEHRNNTVHEYNIEKSREVVKIIPRFIGDTEELLSNLKKQLKIR